MKDIGRKTLLALAVSGMLIGSIGFVAAQVTQPSQASNGIILQAQGQREFGPFGLGLRGVPFGPRLALGTSVEVTFYDGNPEEGGTALTTLTFIYGEDSEIAFAQELAEAREGAAYMVVNIGEQTRTVDLSNITTDGWGLVPRELASRRGLVEGSTITATFYDGNPEEGAQVLQTLTFTYGQDSEAGFANAFTEASQQAAFVTIVTSPQSYTVDLSAAPLDAPGHRGPGQGGFGPGRFR